MSVHYKFKSALDYDTVTFDGLHISVGDLKKAIVQQKRIGRNTDFDLQVTNAQTKEVYNDENALIPKNTSLIIARVPLAAQTNKGRTRTNDAVNTTGYSLRGVSGDDNTVPALSKAVDLSRLDASEEDKIRAMMTQSTLDYDPSNYMKIRGANQMGEVPPNYRCYKCHQPGHWIKNCPLGINQEPVDIKKSTGIPRSFMVPVEGPMVPGAMMTPTGQYAVHALDHQAYNSDGGGRGGVIETEQTPDIPEDLLCSICKDLLTDAVMIPCCGNSFCDECIRTTLLESEDHECPDCREKDISPGTLIPNRFLRNSVSNFKNETGYRKRPQYKPPSVVIQPESVVEELNDTMDYQIDNSSKNQQDQRPIISEADSTEQALKNSSSKVASVSDTKQKEDLRITSELKNKDEEHQSKPVRTEPMSYPQVVVNLMTGEVQPKVTSSQLTQDQQQSTNESPNIYNRSAGGAISFNAPVVVNQQNEERSGTPTIDEPGSAAAVNTHAYPPGETPPFLSPPEQNIHNAVTTTTQNIRPISTYPPTTGYPPQQAPPPGTTYNPPYPAPAGVRRPPPGPLNADYNGRPFLPRMPFDQNRPPAVGSYDGRPPPSAYQGFPPRPGGPPMARAPYPPTHIRNPPPGIRPTHHNPTGVIDDPLAAFERMLREKDERDRRVREARRSRSRSFTPRSRRSRSSSRSRSYSPRSRSPRSRSPPPKMKMRNRSRTPRSLSRSRSRSRGPIIRKSRTPRSRDRSFSISSAKRYRSRSYSRSPSPREYSPRRRPVSRTRYRSPPVRNSPPRYRYPDRRMPPSDRDRGSYNQPPRDRDYPSNSGGGGSSGYYDNQSGHMGFSERGPSDRRMNDRDKEYERDRIETERGEMLPRRGRGGLLSRGHPRGGARYLPSPMRKEYPLIPTNQPTYYSVQEHAIYHHPSNNPPNRLPTRMGGGYPPSLMNMKTMPPMENRSYEPPAPPGTEEPTVPGFESPRLIMYDRPTNATISDAPPGVDPHASDTVLTKPTLDMERIQKDVRLNRHPDTQETRGYERENRSERERKEKKVSSPDWKYSKATTPSKEVHLKSPDKHRHRHRYDTPEKDRNRDRNEDKSSDRKRDRDRDKEKDSSDEDKTKSKSKDKKKKRKEREKEIEKHKRKEEKRKRKEQEKLDKIKKAEEKKLKIEAESKTQEEKNAQQSNESEKETKSPPPLNETQNNQVDDLYSDVLTEGIDTKVVQNYGKIKEETTLKTPKDDVTSTPKRESTENQEANEEKDISFDGIDIYVNENDLLKTESVKSKSKDILVAPLPALSKWEVDDEAQNDKKDIVDETIDNKNDIDKITNKIVTSEVLKHAENAIFKKAINAIRPIEIKKISIDRAKLYAGEKSAETSLATSPVEKESTIIPANIQVTIPTNDYDTRVVDINPTVSIDEQRRSEREIPSAVQKPPQARLSVRERLGSKVDELDKLTKDDKHYDRNRSRTLSPLSRREREESGRNLSDRRIVEMDDRRGKHWNRDRKHIIGRSRSRERNYRQRNDRRHNSYRRDERDLNRRDRDRDYERHKKLDKRDSSKNEKNDKHKDRRSKHSRSRSSSKDRRTPDKSSKSKKKEKKHKKDKEKSKKHKKDDENENKKNEKTNEEMASDKEKKETENKNPVEEKSKITERRKPTLDEANFEPDYDALETDLESDAEKSKSDKKRDRSKSPIESSLKKRKIEEIKKSKSKDEASSSSDSSSDSSSSEEERVRKKHKKHKKKKSSKRVSSSSSSNSDSGSSSDDESKKRKNRTKKHKNSKKSMKKKKKSKHR